MSFSGGGLFLFATVLERFLSLYCSVNSFTRLIARTPKMPYDGSTTSPSWEGRLP